MKAKACTRCRQWKVGCDANISGPEGCTRCRKNDLPCIFNSAFRRTPKRKRLAEMQIELAELRKLKGREDNTASNSTSTALGLTPHSLPNPSIWPATSHPETAIFASESNLQGLCLTDKYLGDIHLAASHVNELFRVYFIRCHPYLPFSISRSIESIYETCPLLFWTICSVSSTDTARSRFEGPIRGLISDILDPTKGSNVEIVQAMLILCMWPFPFITQKTDSSFIYSALAIQISLNLGLHRPAADFGNGIGEREDEDIRRTTWLACFVVAQIQASRRGVPSTVLADYALLSSFDDPAVPRELSHICYISHLAVDSTHALGARGSNTTGLVEPTARISLINVFGKQFDDLRRQRFPKPSNIVEMFFLSSRLQLWSFALHNDVPGSADTLQIICQARGDAIRLIQIACEKNLSLVPWYTRRSVCYAALFLFRIKLGPYGWEDDMIDHHVERAQQALSTSEGPRIGQFLATVTSPENRDTFTRISRDKQSPHRSRMGAFLVFDFQRVYRELQEADLIFHSEFLDFDDLPWTEFQAS